MSATDMAQEDGICAQQCATPDCGSRARLNSSFCATHEDPSSVPSSVNGSPTSRNLPRMTHFTESRVVAKRGPSRLRFPRASRNSIKSQATPSPSPKEAPKGIEILNPPADPHQTEQKGKSEYSYEVGPIAHETNVQPKSAKPGSPIWQGSAPSDNFYRRSASEENRKVTQSGLFHPMASFSRETPTQSLLSPAYGKEDLPNAAQSPKPTSPNLGCTGGPRDRHEPKECDVVGKAQVSVKLPPSISTPPSPNHAQSINAVNKPISASHVESPLSTSSQGSLDSGGAADIESNVDEEPPAPADSDQRNSVWVDRHDTTTTLENSLKPEYNNSHVSQARVENPDGSLPMSLNTPTTIEKPQASHSQVIVDSSLRKRSSSTMRSVITFSRVKSETRRQRLLDNFDSDAFDALIYQQSNLKPPSGVKIPTRVPKKGTTFNPEDLLALHTNPAIHGMHRRSKDWYQKKSKEIEERGGRKAWFGKVAERQRYLRSREAAIERERKEAEMAGRIPPRQDPQPRGHKRIHDFGDVPEEDLPEEVRNNPAWLKACAWHRQTRLEARHNPPPLQPPQPPPPNQSPELQRHMQKAAEEARLFYQETVKKYQSSNSIYGWHP